MKDIWRAARCILPGLGLAALLAGTMCTQATAQVNEDVKLLARDGSAAESFGKSVASSGTTAVVGAPRSNFPFGSAYVCDVTTGQQLTKLLPRDGAAASEFGRSVAIRGTTAVCGAPHGDDNGISSGSAYLFDVTTGQQLAKLLPSDGAAYDWFGWSVALSGTVAVVGAEGDGDNGPYSGSAYVFDATTGQQLAKLLPGDGAAGDRFGYSVALSGTTAVVGAVLDDDMGTDSGSAYVFDVTTGQQLAKLLPSDGAAQDQFGFSVSLSGTTAVVGAYLHDGKGPDSGSTYVFDATTGQQLAELLPSDGAAGDRFGYSVALNGTTAVVGAVDDDESGSNSGSTYVFDVTTGQQLAKLLPSDGAADDRFGYSVAISGTMVVVGAVDDDDNGSNSGSAYVFDPDCNGNRVSDFSDLANGTSTDCDGDGVPDECQIAEAPALDWNGDGVLDSCSSPNFCDVASNSTFLPAAIGARGSPLTSYNDFTLVAWDLPRSQFAYFLTSESSDFVHGFMGSSGNLCLGTPIYRFNDPASGGKVLNSGSTGTVSFTLELNQLPQGITFDPGETWFFQLWFRDNDWFTGTPTSNTTDGIEVMFR